MVEQNVTLRHGIFVGAPIGSGSKGNQNIGNNRKSPYPKGNHNQKQPQPQQQQKESYPQAQSGGSGSNSRNYHNSQRNR